MSSLHEAVENFKNAIVPFTTLVSFVDRVGEVADLESAAEAARNELARASSEKDQIVLEIESQKSSLQDQIIGAQQNAADIVTKAKEQASELIDQAKGEADKILSALQEKQNKMNREVECAEAKRDEALTSYSQASEELDGLNARIAKAKTQIRKLLDSGV